MLLPIELLILLPFRVIFPPAALIVPLTFTPESEILANTAGVVKGLAPPPKTISPPPLLIVLPVAMEIRPLLFASRSEFRTTFRGLGDVIWALLVIVIAFPACTVRLPVAVMLLLIVTLPAPTGDRTVVGSKKVVAAAKVIAPVPLSFPIVSDAPPLNLETSVASRSRVPEPVSTVPPIAIG